MPTPLAVRRSVLRAGALLVLSPAAGLLTARQASAVDLMVTPAQMSAKATTALMLSVFATPRRIVAVGERGLILVSADDGNTWAQGVSPTSVTLTATYFVDDHSGWAVGHSGVVLHTADGAKSWKMQFDGNQANELLLASATRRLSDLESMVAANRAASAGLATQIARAKDTLADVKAGQRFGPARPLLDLWFSSVKDGFVVGSYGQIFETRDAGATWRYIGERLDNPEGLHLNAITGNGSGKVMAVGEAGRVWLSPEDGRRWINTDTGYKGQLYGGLIVRDDHDKEVLIVFGFAGRVFRSVDSGNRWAEIDTGRRKTIVAGKASGNTIALVDIEGAILISNDAGRTYNAASGPLPFQIRGAALTTTKKLFLAGFGGLHVVPVIPAGGANGGRS